MLSSASHGSDSRANAVPSPLQRLRRLSPRDLFLYLSTYGEARRIAGRIDPAAIAELDRRFGKADPAPGYSKYLDVPYWIHAKLRRVHALGLNGPPRRRILDLGTGTGYFPYLAKLYGNDAVGLDMAGNDFYDAMLALLGVERHAWTITPYTKLPELGRFDLVTAFQICFDQMQDAGAWGVPEWDFFRRDVADHLLAPGGRMVLELNVPPSPAVARYFAESGATVRGLVISSTGSRPEPHR